MFERIGLQSRPALARGLVQPASLHVALGTCNLPNPHSHAEFRHFSFICPGLSSTANILISIVGRSVSTQAANGKRNTRERAGEMEPTCTSETFCSSSAYYNWYSKTRVVSPLACVVGSLAGSGRLPTYLKHAVISTAVASKPHPDPSCNRAERNLHSHVKLAYFLAANVRSHSDSACLFFDRLVAHHIAIQGIRCTVSDQALTKVQSIQKATSGGFGLHAEAPPVARDLEEQECHHCSHVSS